MCAYASPILISIFLIISKYSWYLLNIWSYIFSTSSSSSFASKSLTISAWRRLNNSAYASLISILISIFKSIFFQKDIFKNKIPDICHLLFSQITETIIKEEIEWLAMHRQVISMWLLRKNLKKSANRKNSESKKLTWNKLKKWKCNYLCSLSFFLFLHPRHNGWIPRQW